MLHCLRIFPQCTCRLKLSIYILMIYFVVVLIDWLIDRLIALIDILIDRLGSSISERRTTNHIACLYPGRRGHIPEETRPASICRQSQRKAKAGQCVCFKDVARVISESPFFGFVSCDILGMNIVPMESTWNWFRDWIVVTSLLEMRYKIVKGICYGWTMWDFNWTILRS